MKRIAAALFLSTITLVFLVILSTQFGQVPPIGKFFDPLIGFWQVAWQDDFPQQLKFSLPELKNKVTVVFDNRGVPHIFGQNELDVFTTMGYLHARDRLWQMDIQYRFTAGRLSEILGRRTLKSDIDQRRLYSVVTAEQIVANLDTSRTEYQVLLAYARGVNHFIQQLSYRDYPFEFKLLNYQPEAWTTVKSVLVNIMMSGDLSRNLDDLRFARLQQLFSQQDLDALYPAFYPIPYPIIPDDRHRTTAKNSTGHESFNSLLRLSRGNNQSWHELESGIKGIGSNNWVVAGSKTKTGKPILANDPHLDLTLPSIWYEAQLSCPEFDVYGVTIPGAPFVIIGFNRHIAWGLTNCGWDVTDLYRETFDNENHDQYFYNGAWQKVAKISQTIHIKDAPDTTIVLENTHRGPVIAYGGEYFSQQWTGNDTNFDGVTVYWLNKAKSYDDFRQALKFYNCPAQNFIYADVDGNIAVISAGKNPIRRSGLGRSIVDGANDQSEWISSIPFDQLPTRLNPKQGYLASANQQPLNQPTPFYGWNWPSDYRARRINELLKNHDQIDAQAMMKFQTDAHTVQAEVFVPYILQAWENKPDSFQSFHLDSMLYYLNNWNYEMRKNEVGATIFDKFMNNFINNTWKDHYPDGRFMLPGETILEQMTRQSPNSKWFDDVTTDEKEDRDAMIRKSLLETDQQLTEELGKAIGNWTWARYHQTQIPHLLRLKPMGIAPFPNNGGNGTLNVGWGRINTHAPSWRMIVSLENPIRAWGVYPGGQSGNSASKHYIDFLETWKNESYYELLFPKTVSDIPNSLIESQILILSEEKR